ncbi:MAG: uroporphyrinogen decarboxylase [Hyphomicrobiales bacterium]|nr:uroporphyrinogen decarboxylase [Hyphomicrobiales bacterium]
MMRQAGRYLPEYLALRATARDFLDFCLTPAKATEATLQPIRRFGFDAAILFSDILIVPLALGQSVSFVEGEGPRLDPLDGAGDLAKLGDVLANDVVAPVYEAAARVRAALGPETSLIGFCGAPFTVASYMIAGRGTPDQAPARLAAYRDPAFVAALIERLVRVSVDHLAAQVDAGADVVQIFDSWAGVLPPAAFDALCVRPTKGLVAGLRARAPHVKIIAFARASGGNLARYMREVGADAYGLDTDVDIAHARRAAGDAVVTQGNLDPLALLAGGAALDAGVDRVLADVAGAPHVFNLGHGVLPPTPVGHVERLVRRVRGNAR